MKNIDISQSVIIFLAITLAGCQNPQPENPEPADPRSGLLFVSDRSENWDLFLVQPDGSGLTQMTDHPAVDSDPDWSPDGRQIAFVTNRDGNNEIYIMEADGTYPHNLTQNSADDWYPSWSPVGNNP